jgi:sulfite reductase beta subunit
MAFISSGYNPDKPMENRITDIGPQKYDKFYPPVIAKEQGQMAVSRNHQTRCTGSRC